MMYMIRCIPMHSFYTALRYALVRVTDGALVAHRNTYESPSCRISQSHRIFILLSVSLWNDLDDPVFDGVGLAGFKGIVWVNFEIVHFLN